MNKTILCFSGSLRKNSYNSEALHIASRRLKEFASVHFVEIDAIELPLLNPSKSYSVEILEKIESLKSLIHNCDGIMFATPEYNGSISGALKNSIDWISYDMKKSQYKKKLIRDKPISIMSVSTGKLCAIGGAFHLQSIMLHMGAFVMPNKCNLYYKDNFNTNQKMQIEDFADKFIQFINIVSISKES
ncbi:MAG: NAD(P)H-dependent oxidoreductase [Proteobacteria bacterium]|nr:NAD(P)H-dependent oxidoreductase [Pseudomonadota bacterium]